MTKNRKASRSWQSNEASVNTRNSNSTSAIPRSQPRSAVEALLAAGMALTAIPLRSKAPVRRGGQRRENAITGIENAGRLSGQNAGLLHARSRTCALDVDNYDAAEHWLAQRGVALERLFCDPQAVSVSGRAGRGKLLYRLPDGSLRLTRRIRVDGRVILEFRCASTSSESMQDGIAGVHPGGMPYTVSGVPATMEQASRRPAPPPEAVDFESGGER